MLAKGRHRSTKIGIENYLLVFSLETDSFLRPLLRRADKIRRPLAVAIRARKPCLFFLLRVEGWNVLFILFSIYSKNRTAKVRFILYAPVVPEFKKPASIHFGETDVPGPVAKVPLLDVVKHGNGDTAKF